MSGVRVLALRAFRVRGEVVPAGTTATLAPMDALGALESMRGQLVDEADMQRLRAAAKAASAQQMREAGRGAPNPGSPWQRINPY